MTITRSCEVCRHGCHGPTGIDCECGRHFHIGGELLCTTDESVACPTCERRCSPLHLAFR